MKLKKRKYRLEKLMVEILRDSKKPMTLTEIVQVIGIKYPLAIASKTPTNSLYSIIFRNEKRRSDMNIDQLFNKEYVGRDCMYSLKSNSENQSK